MYVVNDLKQKILMANKEKLPWELVEEILSRVPPKSLVRFRIVSKRLNALSFDKSFINNHKTTFRFILTTKSKMYSVSVNPEIQVRELTFDIPGLVSEIPENLVDCNEFLLCDMKNGSAVLNPWLKQSTWFEPGLEGTVMELKGIGYENGSYKMLASFDQKEDPNKSLWKIYDFASAGAWKYYAFESHDSTAPKNGDTTTLINNTGVTLNGTLYRVGYIGMASDSFVILRFDFSGARFVTCCDIPCKRNHLLDALVLQVFEGDRFSLLKQCHATQKIEIWVTKNKIDNWDGENVVWMKFMELSSPNNLPVLVPAQNYQPSYFIEDKRLVVCSWDKTGRAWIYVVGVNKLISKTQIKSVVDLWPLHCTYTPSLVPVPSVQKEEVELKV